MPRTAATKSRTRAQGSALVGVIVLLLVLAMLSTSFVVSSGVEQFGFLYTNQSTQAFYDAESGLEFSYEELEESSDIDGNGTTGSIASKSLGGGTFYTTYGSSLITSYGACGSANRRLQGTAISSASSTASYSYATRTQGTNIYAYDGVLTALVPVAVGAPSTVLSSGEYDGIEVDDGSFHSIAASSNGEVPALRFLFVIDQAEASVLQLDVSCNSKCINGNGGQADGFLLYAWNYATGTASAIGASADSEAEVTVTGEIASALTSYIGGGSSNEVTLFLVAASSKSGSAHTLYCDYVSLTVTY